LNVQFLVHGQLLDLVGLHLVSSRASNAEQKRLMQLREIVNRHWHSSENVIVLGDFNFGDDADLLSALPALRDGAVDLWRLFRDTEPGFTYDPHVNTIAALTTLRNKPMRLDRVLLKRSCSLLKPRSVSLIGTEQFRLTNSDKTIFASDHYGLMCEFVVQQQQQQQSKDESVTLSRNV
jgi:endonuclease/exonuclease/phosphatase family metal-dependent hydrolase